MSHARNIVPSVGEADDDIKELLKRKNPAEKLADLRTNSNPQAQFLWAIFRDLFHYCAVHLEEIADNARDLDFAMRWGFGWNQGPFETWQAAGWNEVARWINEDIACRQEHERRPLPEWVKRPGRKYRTRRKLGISVRVCTRSHGSYCARPPILFAHARLCLFTGANCFPTGC